MFQSQIYPILNLLGSYSFNTYLSKITNHFAVSDTRDF